MQLAELGHPVIGPQSYWKLTPGEVRIYAEGLRTRKERQDEEQAYSGVDAGDPSYNKETRKKRDAEAIEKVEKRIQQRQQNRNG